MGKSLALNFPKALWRQRELLWQLSSREIQGRYRGSVLGWSWSLITPLLTLAVYTFVFSQIFRARWGNLEPAGPLTFAINLFAGLIVFTVFAETANQSPNLVVGKPNLVTKVIFPLEILPAVSVISSLFHALTSLIVLALFQVINFLLVASNGSVDTGSILPSSLLWLPLVWTPLVAGCLSMGWLLAALGVYLRDLGQIVGVAVNLMMFLSAVFYPLESLPPRWQPWLRLNPLVSIIEETRNVALTGKSPSPSYILLGLLAGVIICELSFRIFRKAQDGFADVV